METSPTSNMNRKNLSRIVGIMEFLLCSLDKAIKSTLLSQQSRQIIFTVSSTNNMYRITWRSKTNCFTINRQPSAFNFHLILIFYSFTLLQHLQIKHSQINKHKFISNKKLLSVITIIWGMKHVKYFTSIKYFTSKI